VLPDVLSEAARWLMPALIAFFLVMWARLVVDWVRALQPSWRPRGAALVVAEAAYTITDPPIKVARRIIPPIRVGGAHLEFSWSIVMLVCIALIWVVGLFS
jgi:YggT family protein